MRRRQFLTTTSTVTGVMIAGCSSGDGENPDTSSNGIDTSQPSGPVEAYYTISPEEMEEDALLEEILHPYALLDETLRGDAFDMGEDTNDDGEVDRSLGESTVVAENLDSDELSSRFSPQGSGMSEDELSSIATAENAVVEGDVDIEGGAGSPGFEHLVAVDESEWKLVM